MTIRLGRRFGPTTGGVLVTSLIVVTVIASLGATFIRYHTAASRRQAVAIDNTRALYVAEAGLSEAFLAIAQGKSGGVGSEDQPASFGNGIFWVEAEELADGQIALTSNGLCGAGRFSLSMVVQRTLNPIASLGVFADDEVNVGEGVVIDGYDSSSGNYQEEDPGGEARVGSNADVIVEGDADGGGMPRLGGGPAEPATAIYGDARPGPSGDLTQDPGTLVTGITAPLKRRTNLPGIVIPDIALDGSLVHDGGGPLILDGVQARYDILHVEAGSTLVVRGPATIITDSLILDSGAELSIDSSAGAVTLFCADTLQLDSGALLSNPTQDPAGVALLVGGQTGSSLGVTGAGIGGKGATTIQSGEVIGGTAELEEAASVGLGGMIGGEEPPPPPPPPSVAIAASGEFYGVLYAPQSDVTIPSSLRFFGSVASRQLHLEEGARVTFDEALARAAIASNALPGLLSWRIVALPDSPLVKMRLDPFQVLTLQGKTSQKSSLAHVEQNLDITYRDASGTLKTYNGAASAFDWNDVDDSGAGILAKSFY